MTGGTDRGKHRALHDLTLAQARELLRRGELSPVELTRALLLGKLKTHEFAQGGPAADLPWPPAR